MALSVLSCFVTDEVSWYSHENNVLPCHQHFKEKLSLVFKPLLLDEMSVSVKFCNEVTMKRVIVSVQHWKCIHLNLLFLSNVQFDFWGFKMKPEQSKKRLLGYVEFRASATSQSNENLFWERFFVSGEKKEKGTPDLVTHKSLGQLCNMSRYDKVEAGIRVEFRRLWRIQVFCSTCRSCWT